MTTTVTATATRCEGWWAVEFHGPTGTFNTQARRLDQIPAMVSDILEMEGVTDATVTVEPLLPDDVAQTISEAPTSELSQSPRRCVPRCGARRW